MEKCDTRCQIMNWRNSYYYFSPYFLEKHTLCLHKPRYINRPSLEPGKKEHWPYSPFSDVHTEEHCATRQGTMGKQKL